MRHVEPKPATILAAVLATEDSSASCENMSAYRCARDAESLIRLGKRAAKIAVDRCNGIQRYDATVRQMLATWTDDDDARADKAAAKIEAEAIAILSDYGATAISAHGDPRGFCLTFRLASGRSNSFGGEVWGV